jgi:dephospho-CoA kinase
MLRIGITGPIGCGKSTVARWLGERAGIRVIDADHEARLVLAPETPEVEAVYARFGAALRRPNGELDRAALGRIVFADETALRDLEAIVHPAVRPRILDAMEAAEVAGARAVVIEAIKLVEGGLAELCDEVWLVDCEPAVQLERLVGRGDPADDASARITAQGDIVERLRAHATRVIDTSGDPAATRTAVDSLLDEALRAAT